MVKQRQMTKKKKTVVDMLQRRATMPSHYPKAPGDTFVIPFKFTSIVTILPGDITTTGLLVLGRGTNSTGYSFLNTTCAPFNALSTMTSRWMITDLKVQVRATGVGGTANTFIAASYIPSNSTLDSPPANLAEMSNSMHYAESSLGTVGTFRVRPTDYYNDWRQVVDSDDSDSQAGLIQIYGSGSVSSSGETAGVITVEGVLHFCGYRL